MKRTFKLAAMLFAVLAVFATGCRKDNPNYEFIGEYRAAEMKFDLRLNTSSGAIDLPTVTLKEVTLDLKRSGKENVTGTFKFGSVRGNSYSVKGVCSGDMVLFDEFTIKLDKIFTNDGEVNLDLTLNCVGTLSGKVMNLEVHYKGFGSITENGSTNSGDLEDGVVNVSFTKQGNNNNNNSNHEYVDLGLPSGTLWATCNVGANSPEKCGDYFAWGETQPKADYTWTSYKYCNGSYNTLTKYCKNASLGNNGFTDTLTVLLPEDDAASVNWGSQWKTPTEEQWEELVHNTILSYTEWNGVNGVFFTASNGNSIFLPAAGSMEGNNFGGFGNSGRYWSSSLDPGNMSYDACDYWFNMINLWVGEYVGYNSRWVGYSVRPVRAN